MTGAGGTTYAFDALGRRVRSAAGVTEDYIYRMDGSLAAVYNASASGWERFEFSVGGAQLDTKDTSPPSGYSPYTHTVSDLPGSGAAARRGAARHRAL